MAKRKLQLIAGTTYSISLPKEWVVRNKLRESDELQVIEKDAKSLLITNELIKEKELEELSLDLDEYGSSIDHVLFAAYYLGVESIKVHSKQGIKKEERAKVRKTLAHMSGTEISYEDNEKIHIKVLLDKTKVDVLQLLYRISLILNLSMTGLEEGEDGDGIRINENEIDRLYHLITKMISLSQFDSNVLVSSKIRHPVLAPSYFLLAKRLENIGDEVYRLAKQFRRRGKKPGKEEKEIIHFIRTSLSQCIKTAISDKAKIECMPYLMRMQERASRIVDINSAGKLENILRYLSDIDEEVVGISFYKKMVGRGLV